MKRIAKKHATGLWQVAAELQVIEVELTLTAADDFEKGRTHSRDQIDPSCSDAVMTLLLTFSQKMEDARSILVYLWSKCLRCNDHLVALHEAFSMSANSSSSSRIATWWTQKQKRRVWGSHCQQATSLKRTTTDKNNTTLNMAKRENSAELILK